MHKNATNTRGKPFAKGNPGKPKGARHKVSRAVEALLDGQAEELTRKAIERALAGDAVALRLCLDRICPPRRDRPVELELPAIETAQDAQRASAAVIAAAAAGLVTLEEASRLAALLEMHRAIIETADLEARIAELEAHAPRERQNG